MLASRTHGREIHNLVANIIGRAQFSGKFVVPHHFVRLRRTRSDRASQMAKNHLGLLHTDFASEHRSPMLTGGIGPNAELARTGMVAERERATPHDESD